MTAHPGTTQVRGDFVMLRADSLRLLLPQRDVQATEYRESLPLPGNERGIFELASPGGQVRLVAALSSTMDLLGEFPKNRFLLTRMDSDERGLALAWNEVRVLIDTTLAIHALPGILQAGHGLVDAYVELDGELAFCTTARHVWAETLALQE